MDGGRGLRMKLPTFLGKERASAILGMTGLRSS